MKATGHHPDWAYPDPAGAGENPAGAGENAAGPGENAAGPGENAAGAGERRTGRFGRLRVANLDLRNTWQIVVGSLLLPLGIAFILLAWSGAAHGRIDQQQIPYLVSGGLGGLAVVMIGCFFYWAHWLYRIYDQADLHHQEAMREQREMMNALIDALTTNSGRPAGAAGAGAAGTGAAGTGAAGARAVGVGDNGHGGRTFVATPAGTNFHTAGCPMVANRAGQLRTVTEEEAADMKPCRVCEPLMTAN